MSVVGKSDLITAILNTLLCLVREVLFVFAATFP